MQNNAGGCQCGGREEAVSVGTDIKTVWLRGRLRQNQKGSSVGMGYLKCFQQDLSSSDTKPQQEVERMYTHRPKGWMTIILLQCKFLMRIRVSRHSHGCHLTLTQTMLQTKYNPSLLVVAQKDTVLCWSGVGSTCEPFKYQCPFL